MVTGRSARRLEKANVTPIFRKDKNWDPGNCRLLSLTLTSGKVMEQLLKTISRHSKKGQIISRSQPGFNKGKSCLTSCINFYNEMIGLAHEGRAVAIFCLSYSKALDVLSHKTLIEKLLMYEPGEQ